MNLINNECETLRDVRIYKHASQVRWIVAAIDPRTMRGAIMILDDGGSNLESPAYGTDQIARSLAAGGPRRHVLPLLPAGVARTAIGMALHNCLPRTTRVELWQWLRETMPPSQYGARLGYALSEPWPDVPVRVATLPLDRGGYTPDGTYYGLRLRGQRLYALHQQRADGTGRQLVGTLDADCRGTAMVKAKAWADERGLPVYRTNAARKGRTASVP